jgi:HEAT repeat protein
MLKKGWAVNNFTIEELITQFKTLEYKDCEAIARNIASRQPAFLDMVIPLLEHENGKVRYWGMESLGSVYNERVIELLFLILDDEDEELGYFAAFTLGKCGKVALPGLLAELKRKGHRTQFHAISALTYIDDPATVEPLIEALNDESYQARELAAIILGDKKDPRAVEPLLKALHDEEWLVRCNAIRALSEYNDAKFLDVISERLADESSYVRDVALSVLLKMKGIEG